MEYSTRYYDNGRLTLMPFWRAARRRKWGIFTVLTMRDYLPLPPAGDDEWA